MYRLEIVYKSAISARVGPKPAGNFKRGCREAAHPDRNISVKTTGDLNGDWDSLRMAQVLSNLIGNAIQHGGKTSAIRVTAKGTPQEVQLSVHNDGAAILPAVISTIFDPMTRGKRLDEPRPGPFLLPRKLSRRMAEK